MSESPHLIRKVARPVYTKLDRAWSALAGRPVARLRLQSRDVLLLLTVLVAAPSSACPAAVAIQSSASQQSIPATEPSLIDAETQAACVEYLRAAGRAPTEYVAGKFADHDLVLLGEVHEVRDTCEFVSALVPALYRDAGVRCLVSEFIRRRNNDRIERIVTAKEYDEAAVIDVFRDGPWPTWGYREYVDTVRAVWALNASLPPEAPQFRLVGMDGDWDQVALLTEKDAMKRFNMIRRREQDMFDAVAEGVIARKEKALVHVGFAHTVDQGERLAARLADVAGLSIAQVVMHHDVTGTPRSTGRFTLMIEDIVSRSERAAVGFDVVGSPLEPLREDGAVVFRMLGSGSGFGTFAQGYVFLKPTSQLRPVTWVDGFINDALYARALECAERMKMVEEGSCKTAADLNAALAKRLRERENR